MIVIKRLSISRLSPKQCFSTKPRSFADVLGVSHHASSSEIKDAYYKLSKKYHPDSPTANADQFIAVKEAYEALKAPSAMDTVIKINFTEEDKRIIKQRFFNYYKTRTGTFTPKDETLSHQTPSFHPKPSLFEEAKEYVKGLEKWVVASWISMIIFFIGMTVLWWIRTREMEEHLAKNPHIPRIYWES